MKRLLLLLPLVFIMMISCEVIVVEGPVPVHDNRNRFVGFYDVEEYDISSDLYTEYTFNIVKSANYSRTIYIRNFFGVGIEVLAEVNGYDLYIPEQEVDGFYIEGSGYIEDSELILNYSVHDHLDSHSHVHYYEAVAW